MTNPRNVGIITAMLSQVGTLPPTTTVLQNTITDLITWGRISEGRYYYTAPAGTFPPNKTYIPGMGDFADAGSTCIPITDGAAITGYLYMYLPSDYQIFLDIKNAAFNYVDLATLIGTSKIFLPEIKVYNL